MSKRLLMTLLAVLTPLAGSAAQKGNDCKRNLSPMLIVQAEQDFRLRSIGLPPQPYHLSEQVTVTRGGAATVIRTRTPAIDPEEKVLAAGSAANAQFQTLRNALVSSQIEDLRDCVVENDLSGPTGARILGTIDFTWIDPSGVRNRFTVQYADPGTTPLPRCDPAVEPLVLAVRTFERAIYTRPANVRCAAP